MPRALDSKERERAERGEILIIIIHNNNNKTKETKTKCWRSTNGMKNERRNDNTNPSDLRQPWSLIEEMMYWNDFHLLFNSIMFMHSNDSFLSSFFPLCILCGLKGDSKGLIGAHSTKSIYGKIRVNMPGHSDGDLHKWYMKTEQTMKQYWMHMVRLRLPGHRIKREVYGKHSGFLCYSRVYKREIFYYFIDKGESFLYHNQFVRLLIQWTDDGFGIRFSNRFFSFSFSRIPIPI